MRAETSSFFAAIPLTKERCSIKIKIGIIPKKGEKMTKKKAAILECVRKSDRHLTAEEILFEVRKKIPSVSLSTVYRNLGQLTEENRIGRVEIDERKCVYDRSILPHAHAVNVKSGEISDVFSDKLNAVIQEIVDKKVVSYQLVIQYEERE